MGSGRYTKRGRERAEAIEAILREAGRGMTCWEITEALMERGVISGENYRSMRGGVESSLASLQGNGVLVSEDEAGQIWLFEERGLYSLRDWDRWR